MDLIDIRRLCVFLEVLESGGVTAAAEQLAVSQSDVSFHVKQLAYLTDKLQKTKDADGTLFDNTLLLYGSGMSDSNLHIPTNLPLTVVAGQNFDLKGNRFLRYPQGTPMANLHLRLLEMYGMHMEQFADSKGELNSLSV